MEDYAAMSPWRERYLAASVFNPQAQMIRRIRLQRTRAALEG
jgi:hypothetical protein